MWRYIKGLLVCGPIIIYAYFAWMIRYARHPEKYPLEKRYYKARKLIRLVSKWLRVDYQIKNYELLNSFDKPFILVGNHRSDYDALLYIALSEKPITFVAKKEIKKFPFIGKIVKAIGGVFIDREDIRQQLKIIKQVEESLNVDKNLSWVIFPEGTRNKKPDETPLLDFHPGSFKIYQKTDAPLLYCALYGTERVFKTKHYKKYPCTGEVFGPMEDEFKNLSTVEMAKTIQNSILEHLPVLKERDENILKSYKKK